MELFDKLFKRNQQEKLEETKQEFESLASVLKKEPSVMEKYPDGLPLMVLEYIDYSKFGAMLKQEQLLPPSYDRRPIKVDIDEDYGKPRVILTFKSKTSDSWRMVSISGYSVAYSQKINQPITILEVNEQMSKIWYKFAGRTMYLWDRGYRFELLDHKRKGEIGKNLMQEEVEYEESIKEIAKCNKKAQENQEVMRDKNGNTFHFE